MRRLGGINATALTKHVQQHPLAHKMHLKLAIVSQESVYVRPQTYFGVCHAHISDQQLLSGAVPTQVDNWSRIETGVRLTSLDANANELKLSNGKTFTYKALVLAPGFDHTMEPIEGLEELQNGPEEDHVFVHMMDNKHRTERNFYHGW